MTTLYERAWPLIRQVPTEWAHTLGMRALALPISLGTQVDDPFEWRGLRIPNRVGVAAGFDKDAAVVRGVAGMGAGFIEVGTVLTRPWQGNPRPRMSRVAEQRAIWNRMGFPSDGLSKVRERLAALEDPGLTVACNIAPHPLTIRSAEEPGFLGRAQAELDELVTGLHPHAAFFVINLSSPNTKGLRGVLHGSGFANDLVAPTRARIAELDAAAGRAHATPLLVKLPPVTGEGEHWEVDSLAQLVRPLLPVCDGFVAVNTSIQLALRSAPEAREDFPGGLSGAPLLPLALHANRVLAELAPDHLRIAAGGVCSGADAGALIDAGAHLVEVFSGMIYRGPGLVAECAEALRSKRVGQASGR
jgi:dihydroorotate dehydrogenase